MLSSYYQSHGDQPSDNQEMPDTAAELERRSVARIRLITLPIGVGCYPRRKIIEGTIQQGRPMNDIFASVWAVPQALVEDGQAVSASCAIVGRLVLTECIIVDHAPGMALALDLDLAAEPVTFTANIHPRVPIHKLGSSDNQLMNFDHRP